MSFLEDNRFSGLKEPLECLMAGKWGFTAFNDLPLSGEWSTIINTVPIAVNVCITPDCSANLKDALWKLSPITPEFLSGGELDMGKLGEELMNYAGERLFLQSQGAWVYS